MSEIATTTQSNIDVSDVLFKICTSLEITITQQNKAETSYGAVGKWLSDSEHPFLINAEIYPQGSIRLQTTVKPIGRDEFDVDLVCHLPNVTPSTPAMDVYQVIGGRLAENEVYKKMLTPKNRCWELNYAGDFHMDITPAVPDKYGFIKDAIEVPDKEKSAWKDSNPKGYTCWFNERAVFQPKLAIETRKFYQAKAEIESLPDGTQPAKDWLRKTVQILKRHRDITYLNKSDENKKIAPISIIITTLTAKAYKAVCLSGIEFDSFLSVLKAVVTEIPNHIQVRITEKGEEFYIPNETTRDENFAEKWNSDPLRAKEFYAWHNELTLSLAALNQPAPLYKFQESLKLFFGEEPVTHYFNEQLNSTNTARNKNKLSVNATSGITTSAGIAIPNNQFFSTGKDSL